MNRAEDYVKAQMIEAAWKYAQHLGGVNGMLGVLHVIKNRYDAGWGSYGHILDTMEKWEAAPAATKTHPEQWERRFVSLLGIVDSVCDGTHRPDVSNGAVYFGDTTNITNEWFLEHVARNPERMLCANTSSWTYWKNIDSSVVLTPVSVV
jgi:hypothetical protein